MSFFRCPAVGRSRYLLSLILAALLLGGFPPPPATADPPERGIASVAEGAADDVLGQLINMDFSQPDFTHGGANDSATVEGLNQPYDVALDAVNHRLFVADTSNHRVLVFDLTAANALTDRRADRVLGQADFKGQLVNRDGSAAANTLRQPQGLAYDPSGNRLFVADTSNSRVVVYDTTTITNGEDAVAVLGQANFTSGTAVTTQGGLRAPAGLAYDSANNRLFVSDWSNSRVLVYDVAAIANGENAVAVLGQADFTSDAGNRGGSAAANTLWGPIGAAYDPSGNRLLVADWTNNRVLVYDTTTITNGQSAVAVLGQATFTSNTAATTQSGLKGPNGLAYEATGQQLFVADKSNNRVLLFNAAPTGTAVSINGGATYATAITATLALTATGAVQMQVSESASFTGATYQAYATTLPWTLSASDGAKALYARFRDSALGVSTAVSDTILLDTTPPLTFTLSSPATGAFTNTASPLLSWGASSDATSGLAKYQLYVDGALNRDNVVASSTSTTPTGALTDGLHTWGLVAVDNVGYSRQSSATNSLTVDTVAPVTFSLASPATGTFTNTASPTLAWEPSSDATSGLAKYQLYLDGALNRDNVLTTTTTITPTSALTDGLHTWSVAAVDSLGNSRDSSSTNSLTVDTTPPLTFTLSSPATGAYTNTASPLFSWGASSDATSGLAKYQLYVDGALNRDNVLTTTTSITPTSALTDGLHTWSVAAVDNAGNTRAPTSTYTVTVDTVAPSISGVVASGVTTSTATIAWTSSEAASSQVEYGLTDAYGSATTEADTSTRVVSHTVSLSGLTPGTTYHYRAKGRDEAGNSGASGDSTFTTLSPIYIYIYFPWFSIGTIGGW